MSFLDYLFDASNYPARRNCGLWTTSEVITHNVADAVILFCYTAIPIFLIWYAHKRHKAKPIFYLFASFIFACGLTHAMDIVMFYWPAYRLAGAVLVFCAAISLGTLGFILWHFHTILQMRTQEEMEQEVIDATTQLRINAQSKDEFIAMLGHELRNPLAAISNASNLLDISDEKEDRETSLRIIKKQTEHLVHLVDDIIHVSRIIKGKMQLHLEAVPATEIVQRAVEIAEPLLDSKNHTLIRDVDNITLHVDKHRIVQMLSNLLTNAAKYTPDKGKIIVRVKEKDGVASIQVEDNGIGIENESIGDIFNLYVRTKRASVKESGFGLGLTMVKTIVERHGGSVVVESQGTDRGSRFEVTLPSGAS
jgi:signal transduction histidine kinase